MNNIDCLLDQLNLQKIQQHPYKFDIRTINLPEKDQIYHYYS